MKHIVNIAGMIVVAFVFCVVAVLGETRVLYQMVSGIPQDVGTLDEWVEGFSYWALIGIAAALVASLLWYVLARLSQI